MMSQLEHVCLEPVRSPIISQHRPLARLVEVYPSPGYTDEIIYVFLADGADYAAQHLDDDEFINAEFVEIEKVVSMIESGEICDAKTIAAVYKYLYDVRAKG